MKNTIFNTLLSVMLMTGVAAAQTILPLKTGDKAKEFILTTGVNTIRSFSLPQNKRISLLHFWNTETANSKLYNGYLLRLLSHYENASFINASGFEIIAIAVQNDLQSLNNAIGHDSLGLFTHGMAINGLEDEVCKNYGINNLPADILVDEKGTIIAVNPRLVDVENLLEERKNYQPIKKDIEGLIAAAGNKEQVLKNTNLNLYNYYGDSITSVKTDEKGAFIVRDIKLNQDFVLKVTNQGQFHSSQPLSVYTMEGEAVTTGTVLAGHVVFDMFTAMTNKLIMPDKKVYTNHLVEELDVIKSLSFAHGGKKLSSKDEHELNILVYDMQKNNQLRMEFFVHTDSKVDETKAMEITTWQVSAIMDYFKRKGLDICRVTGFAKGNSEMRKLCVGTTDCNEEDHKFNRRVEFVLFKDPELTE